MFHFLGFLFVIIVFVLVIGLSLIGTLLRSIFGIGGRRTYSDTYQPGNGNAQSSKGYSFAGNRQEEAASQTGGNETSSYRNDIRKKRKKVFDKDDGEYVDFEEIKE